MGTTRAPARPWGHEREDLTFDYTRQAWVKNGLYVRCGHPESMDCRCYGRVHEGEPANLNLEGA